MTIHCKKIFYFLSAFGKHAGTVYAQISHNWVTYYCKMHSVITEYYGRLICGIFPFRMANVKTVLSWEGVIFHHGPVEVGPEHSVVADICLFNTTLDILLLKASSNSISWPPESETCTCLSCAKCPRFCRPGTLSRWFKKSVAKWRLFCHLEHFSSLVRDCENSMS